MRLFFGYDFPNWNIYCDYERTSLYKANKVKQQEKQFVCMSTRQKWAGGYPVTLTVRPHFKNKKRDLDNFRMKGLIDGLVAAGVLKNDNLTCIDKIILEPIFDNVVGVEIEITETKGGDQIGE